MKRILILVATAAAAAVVLASLTASTATARSLFVMECNVSTDNPVFRYYAPWNQRYVRGKAYARCVYWNAAHTISYPLNVDEIQLTATLYRETGVDEDGNIVWEAWDGPDTSTVYAKSLTSVTNDHNCGPYTDTPWDYKEVARGHFMDVGYGIDWTIDKESAAVPIICT